MNQVLESAEFISSKSFHVSCPPAGIKRAADFLIDQMSRSFYSFATWKTHPLNPKEINTKTLDWIFLVDLLNFSFFSDAPKGKEYAVTFKGQRYTGYWTLCACINRALEKGIPITRPSFYSQVSARELKEIFSPDSTSIEEIPLLKERLEILCESGRILETKFGGSFTECIKQANKSAQTLLTIIINSFPSFRDQHEFNGRTVYIYKRAQILIADIWACFEGKGLGEFKDIDTITMFADYRVPQALVGIGAMEYSEHLLKLLRNPTLQFKSGDALEVEIRGNSIWAVELVRREILSRGLEAPNSIMIDFLLWDYAKANSERLASIPIHKTRSIFY